MKNLILLFVALTVVFGSKAQTMKEYKGGHVFTINLPDYMIRTVGLNDVASIQYKSDDKDVAGFVIYDTKEELALAEVTFASVREFYDGFIADFLTDQENRQVSEPVSQTKAGINFIEADATYYDKELETEIYYHVGVVETKKSFYKVLAWSAADKKDQFKADFQKILYSLKD
ncbi:MAG: hypothetical protein U0U09_16695 [Cyclobacteriaceae bacterium]